MQCTVIAPNTLRGYEKTLVEKRTFAKKKLNLQLNFLMEKRLKMLLIERSVNFEINDFIIVCQNLIGLYSGI